MRSSVAALLALAILLGASPAHAQQPGDEVRGALARASAAIEAASQAPEGDRARLVAEALATLDSSAPLAADKWLHEPLVSSPPDLSRARTRFAAALAASPAVQADRDPTSARAALSDVLALSAFQEHDWISDLPAWLVPAALVVKAVLDFIWNAMRWPLDRLLDLIARIVGDVLRGPIVVMLAVLVVLGLALLYQRGLRSAIVRQAEVAGADQPLPPTASEALALAAHRGAAGRYREACHFVLLSTLLAIEERGQTRFDPSATNREHLAKLAGWPPVARALERVVARFDHIWYGQNAATEADYRELLSLASGVSEVAG